MRIIAGRFRSRKLKSVPGMHVRPTPDRLRESLFSILMPRIQGSVFLDAYAGTGTVGLEALSRGARHVVLIELKAQLLAVLRKNVDSLAVASEVTIVRGGASVLLPNYPCDIAFLDPPYDKETEYAAAMGALSATECRLALAQHASRFVLEEKYGALKRVRVLKQGDNSVTFYERDL